MFCAVSHLSIFDNLLFISLEEKVLSEQHKHIKHVDISILYCNKFVAGQKKILFGSLLM